MLLSRFRSTRRCIFGFLFIGLALLGCCFLIFHSGQVFFSRRHVTNSQDKLIHAVLTFPLLTDPNFNAESYRHLNYKEREQRMEEYLTSLRKTLAHPRIGHVHCLYDQTLMVEHVEKIISGNNKLKFHFVKETHVAASLFQFVFKELSDRLVMVLQADTYPAQGFHQIETNAMKKKRLFYALTRHGKMEDACDMNGDFCDVSQYVGSHDAYIFVPSGALSAKHVGILNQSVTSWGVDLVIAWLFQDMGYTVLNPCKVIFVYHIHCSSVRSRDRKRVNTRNTTGWFPPTARLT